MKVLLFAQCREAAACDHCELNVLHPVSPSDLWSLLVEARPELAPFQKAARLARNGAYVQSGEILNPDDEIAVIPPVSGG